MKSIYWLVLAWLVVAASACEKEEQIQVPQLALATFTRLYPSATNVKWELVLNQYHVSFTYLEKNSKAKFTYAGDWLITQTTIRYEDIPQVVIDSLFASEFKFWVIQDQTLEETPGYGQLYRLELLDNAQIKPIYFRPNGERVIKGF